MEIEFVIENLILKVPIRQHLDNEIDYVVHTKETPIYLLIGLNKWFDYAKLIRIPLDNESLKGLSRKKFVLRGIFPKNEKLASKYYLGSILNCLMIPIKSKWDRITPQRHSKEFVLFLDLLYQKDSKLQAYNVRCMNKYREETLCSFTFRVLSYSSPPISLQKHFISLEDCNRRRKLLFAQLKQEQEHFNKFACESALKFKYFAPGTEIRNLFAYQSFFGDQPTQNYLNFKIRKTNQEWWLQGFTHEMLKYKTMHSISLKSDDIILWMSLDVYEQSAIEMKMKMHISNYALYIKDGVIRKNGNLDFMPEDYSENTNEGGDDCDGKANTIVYVSLTFQSSDPFEHPCLEEMRKRSQKYVPMFTHASLSEKGDPYSKDTIGHATTITILKAHLFSIINLHIAFAVYGEMEFKSLMVAFLKLKEYEIEAGNCVNYVINSKGVKEQLPSIIIGEGTVPLSPFPTFIHHPGKDVFKKEAQFRDSMYKMIQHGAIPQSYMTDKIQLLPRFFMFVTEWFIKHPYSPTNIPTLLLSTKANEECTFEKGVNLFDIYDPVKTVAFPQTKLLDLEASCEILDDISLLYFDYCPLETNDFGECISRISTQTNVITPPNATHFIEDHIPSDDLVKISTIVWIPSGNLKTFIKHIGKDRIVGNVKFKRLPHITGYLLWVLQ